VVADEEPVGNVGTRGDDNGVGWGFAVTILHMGHPDRGENELAEEVIVRVRGKEQLGAVRVSGRLKSNIPINKRLNDTATFLQPNRIYFGLTRAVQRELYEPTRACI
jgi:hypothetical protein